MRVYIWAQQSIFGASSNFHWGNVLYFVPQWDMQAMFEYSFGDSNYSFGDSNSGVTRGLQNEILVDARAKTAQHWKFCRWRQLSSMPIYNSVQKEKVLLSSYFQTSPNIVRVSGEQAVFAPAAASTPPHCDNTLHSSSCFKLCPCPLSVSCYAALGCTEQRASAQWLMNLELNYSTKLTTGRSQARAPENRRQCCYKSIVLQTLCLLSHWSMVYGTVSTSAMLYLLIYTQFLVSKVVTPLRGKSVRIGVCPLDREGGECWRAGDVIVM